MNDFKRGPYGEIFPSPLVSSGDEEEALAALARDAEQRGSPITMPSRGQSLKGMINQGMVRLHQLNLQRALRGEMPDDPDAQALYQAVVVEGEPMSLRPLGLESLAFTTFAPVLRHLQDKLWRIGLPPAPNMAGKPGQGRTEIIAADEPGQALEKAWRLYVKWSNEESEQFGLIADKLLAAVPHSLYHDYWAGQLRSGQPAFIAPNVTIEWLGKHQTFRLTSPKGTRIFSVSGPERAARVAEAITRQAKIAPAYPAADDVLQSLKGTWADSHGEPLEPAKDLSDVWHIGNVRARWDGWGATREKEKRIGVLSLDERRYALTLMMDKDNAGASVQVSDASEGQAKTLGTTHLTPIMVSRWLTTYDGQMALLIWAALQIERTETNG